MAVCLGIYAAANVSGGHINPAVTFGFFVQGRLGHTFLDNLFMLVIYIRLVGTDLEIYVPLGLLCWYK